MSTLGASHRVGLFIGPLIGAGVIHLWGIPAVFVLAAAMLNPLCLLLSPIALAWVLFYSYTKRFTRWSHLALGLGLGIAPVGGYLAVTGRWSELVREDPTDEAAHVALARELVQRGDVRAAERQLERMEQSLRRELGTVPSGEARRLREEIVARTGSAAPAPPEPSVRLVGRSGHHLLRRSRRDSRHPAHSGRDGRDDDAAADAVRGRAGGRLVQPIISRPPADRSWRGVDGRLTRPPVGGGSRSSLQPADAVTQHGRAPGVEAHGDVEPSRRRTGRVNGGRARRWRSRRRPVPPRSLRRR